jgi:hypothetical protein
MKQKATRAESGKSRSASLVDALQALAAEMSKADTELEAEEGLKRLRHIQAGFLKGSSPAGAAEARRNAEALVGWLEARLEQLRQQLARKRRAQEGEAMERIARQREADAPELFPSEMIDALMRAADKPDKQKPAPAASDGKTDQPGPEPDDPDRQHGEQERKPAAEKRKAASGTQIAPAEPPSKTLRPEDPSGSASPPVGVKTDPTPAGKPASKSEWTMYERLAAHLAASVQEDPRFFEKLRAAAKRNGTGAWPVRDQPASEAHFRSVQALNWRLVHLELHAKAIARAAERREPVASLMKTAAREIKGFLQDLRHAKEVHSERSEEYEREFGGYAEQLSAMKPVKGRAILDLCRAERQPKPREAAEDAPKREPEVLQLVLKREDD